ncbi:MAG: lysophospholipase [Rhodobacteraceae bacterium]|nr:lysophospholipase [Paracoccaceae bacterium]
MKPFDVVMIGDSITAGGRWDARFPGIRIANRGVSGDTALKILSRMDAILETKPKRALLMFGINDIYNGVPVKRILGRYDRIVDILKSRGIDVVIQSTLACSGPVCGDKLARVHTLNTGLRKLARAHGLKFIDINQVLSDRSGLKVAFSRDGVHLNSDGYARWYAVLKPHIRRA